ncbi:MAG: DEAD/DEAH box helicase, partial [Bacteroidota bacterium]
MRKTYGNTWWGRQWLNALNRIDYSNRLPRGRTYANKGAVISIDIDRNRITAMVQGSRRQPYEVNIQVPVFTAPEKARIIETVTANPVFLSKLLNRELPSDLYEVFRRQGIEIFPNSWDDLDGHCSCPDWAVPCKHMAAVLYLVANEIDKRPFLVFELHDFDLFKGLEGIGYTANLQKDIAILRLDELHTQQEEVLAPFEWEEEQYAQIDFSHIPDCREQLMTLLTPHPVFYPYGNFKQILSKGYTATAKLLHKDLEKERVFEVNFPLDLMEDIELCLDGEAYFLHAHLFDHKEQHFHTFTIKNDFVDWLRSIPLKHWPQLSPRLKALLLVNQLAEKLILQGAYVPQIVQMEDGRVIIRWLAATLNEEVRELCEQVGLLVPLDLMVYEEEEQIYFPKKEVAFSSLLSFFLDHYVQQYWPVDTRMQDSQLFRLFFRGWLEDFQSFENREYPGAIHLWLSRFYLAEKSLVPILQIEDQEDNFKVNLVIDDRIADLKAPLSLHTFLQQDRYKDKRLGLLRDLASLTDFFPQLSQVIASQGQEELSFDARSFVPILLKIIPIIRLFGIEVLLPKALRKLLRPQLSVQLEGEENGTVALSSIISLENMLRFKWQVALGGELLSPTDFRKMVEQFSGIVKLNDQYVYFDEKDIKQLIERLENPPDLNGHDLLQMALTEEYKGARIRLDQKAQDLMEQLIHGDPPPVPQQLKATLRPYQLRGYEWLYKNSQLGFGSLIADDMGLGKTLQVIATLLQLKEQGLLSSQKGLIIVPTTLISNWAKEIQKFAPSLNTHIYHGPGRSLEPLADADLMITTYGVARSEQTLLSKKKWLVVVIDEAQNIKNPGTAQTKAIKKIKAPVRIAMSGTPVENRLSEYWSIFDFANKGYLGSLKHFKEEVARPIEVDRDQKELRRFRKITSPFILRRLKTDKSIIQDLPDKIEQNQYAQLSKEQAALYQNVLDQTLKAVNEAEGINRRGLILKLITALKQVCNHPHHFLKKGPKEVALSGKMQLLLALLQPILEQGEKTLIF